MATPCRIKEGCKCGKRWRSQTINAPPADLDDRSPNYPRRLRRLVEDQSVPERVRDRELLAPLLYLDSYPQGRRGIGQQLALQRTDVGHAHTHSGSRRRIRVMLAQVQHHAVFRHLAIPRKSHLELVLPVDSEPEKVSVETYGLPARKRAQDGYDKGARVFGSDEGVPVAVAQRSRDELEGAAGEAGPACVSSSSRRRRAMDLASSIEVIMLYSADAGVRGLSIAMHHRRALATNDDLHTELHHLGCAEGGGWRPLPRSTILRELPTR